ncbi:30S ribosomal protein S17e [Candidatus Woesearchaeota archaeon]|nr:30S ribosomal protein S17e [Candidatus Woesearchaeota archaeon]
MGRIKTAKIKRSSNMIMKSFDKELKLDFESNKKLISQLAEIPSKKIRNIVAGYVTRLKNMQLIEEKILKGELPMKKKRTRSEFSEGNPREQRRSRDRDREYRERY